MNGIMSDTNAAEKTAYNPMDPKVKHEPYPYYAELRAKEPVKYLKEIDAYGIATYDYIDLILKDGRLFSSAQFWPALLGEYDPVPEVPPLISMDPPRHMPRRKLVNRAFVPSKINEIQKRTEAISKELIEGIIAKNGPEGQFDWVWDFTSLFPVTVICEILGVPTARRAEFKVWVDKILSAANRAGYDDDELAEIADASKKMRAFFEEIYDDHVANPRDDMMSAFIEAEIDGEKFSRAEVIQMGVLLLVGGVETTTNLLGTTLVELQRHPEVYERVRNDRSLIPALIEEVLRYNPPVQIIFRHSTADTEIGGVHIPAGSAIMPLLASANRDETKFDRPEEFDIDRKINFPLMSFGQGPHFCLGNYLARMEARTALEIVFDRFSVLEPISDQVEWIDSYFARGPHKLQVRYVAN